MVLTSLFQYEAAWYELSRRRSLYTVSAPVAVTMGNARVTFPQASCWLIFVEFAAMVTASVVFVASTHGIRLRRAREIQSSTPAPTRRCDAAYRACVVPSVRVGGLQADGCETTNVKQD